jgi:hypothetical protein
MEKQHGRVHLSAAAIAAMLLAPSIGKADTWRGTAPFCAGDCLPGETEIARNTTGDGGQCLTGTKVLCRNEQPTCPATQTNTYCVVFVKMCDNGYYELPDVWRSCSVYACGVCLFG